MPRSDNGEPLSLRRSLIVWLAGGVFGWIVAVVLIYGTIRATSYDNVAKEQQQESESVTREEKALQDIAPAAGPNRDDTSPSAPGQSPQSQD